MSSTTLPARRSADPYADTDVVDVRAPRFLQATIGAGAVLALVTGWWWLYGLLALQLVVGLVLGRRGRGRAGPRGPGRGPGPAGRQHRAVRRLRAVQAAGAAPRGPAGRRGRP